MSSKLTIDLTHAVQENFLGNNAIYHGFAGLPDDKGREYTEEQCELEASRASEMKLKIARTFYQWYDYENGEQNYENATMQAFCRWLARMQKHGITVALNTGWCNPGDINSTSWNGRAPFTVEGDWEKSVENFANWVSETVHYLIEVKGFTNLKYLVMFTEPQNGSGKYPEGMNAYDTWLSSVKATHEQLVKDNRRHLVKLVGPNEGSTNYPKMLKWATENANEYLDIYSSHNYLRLPPDSDVDFEIPEDDHRYVYISTPGGRIQQFVCVEPNCEYEIKATLQFNTKNHRTSSGHILIGAFENDGCRNISGGGQETTRLNLHSVKMFDTASLNTVLTDYAVPFSSLDAAECIIGIFCDIKNKSGSVLIKNVSLYKKGTDQNLLENSDFEEEIYSAISPDGAVQIWKEMSTSICSKYHDHYYDWLRWGKAALQFVPKNKEYWFDEYNVLGEKKKLFREEAEFDLPIHGTRLAQAEVGLMNAGIQSSLMWTLFDQQWPKNHSNAMTTFVDGDHRIGLMPVFARSYVPHPAYYAFSLVSRYMGGGEGTCVYPAMGENRVQATLTKMPDGSVGLLVVNCKDASDDIIITFGTTLGVTLYRHLYDPVKVNPTAEAKLIGIDKVIFVDALLSDKLPAYATAIYTSSKD